MKNQEKQHYAQKSTEQHSLDHFFLPWDDFQSILGSSVAPPWAAFLHIFEKIGTIRLIGCSWVSVECSRVDFTSILPRF